MELAELTKTVATNAWQFTKATAMMLGLIGVPILGMTAVEAKREAIEARAEVWEMKRTGCPKELWGEPLTGARRKERLEGRVLECVYQKPGMTKGKGRRIAA